MSQIDDVEAIHTYMVNTPSQTPAAETIRTAFMTWYDNAGFWDKNMSSDWYDEARTRRNQYNLANAVTPAQTAQVQNVIATGQTTEQMQGKPRPAVNPKTGAVGSQVKSATPLSAAGAPVLTRVLKQGMNGDDVKTWQSFLALTPPTGYFDALTTTKTKAFQGSKKLVVDGAVGKMTWGAAFPVATQPQMAPSDTAMFAPAPGSPPKSTAKAAAHPPPPPVTPPASGLKVLTAGLDPSSWSTGAKVIGGLAAVALAGGALMKHSEAHPPGRSHR